MSAQGVDEHMITVHYYYYTDTIGESALKADWEKNHCRTEDSNALQYSVWHFCGTLYQVSYLRPSVKSVVTVQVLFKSQPEWHQKRVQLLFLN